MLHHQSPVDPSSMTYQTIEFSVADNIATIQLDRANDANALNSVMADELHDASIQCATRPDVRCVIITGKGKLFCGGGDLNEFKDVGDQEGSPSFKNGHNSARGCCSVF